MLDEEMVWKKDNEGRYVPCEKRLCRIIPHPKGLSFLMSNGERIRGIEHPSGCLIGYLIRYSKLEVKKHY